MELIAQRGLPVNAQAAAATVEMAGDEKPVVQAPLTTGFARTGYELETIEAREQKMSYGKAEGETQGRACSGEVTERSKLDSRSERDGMTSWRTIRGGWQAAVLCCALLSAPRVRPGLQLRRQAERRERRRPVAARCCRRSACRST